MAVDITDRLLAVMAAGNLTVADLARWFGIPDPTVRGWVRRRVALGGAPRDIADMLGMLKDIETRVARKRGFPVPRMSQPRRISYLRTLRSAKTPA
jgi:hypothetical protein